MDTMHFRSQVPILYILVNEMQRTKDHFHDRFTQSRTRDVGEN